jgi:glycosyltransferase involved in cell wall biosynthesis
MATYNGQSFLAEQLASILDQDRPPDEVVIRDDCSTDLTMELVSEFATAAPFAVRVTRNPRRLGAVRNFLTAAQECHGDLVAFCDQDDIWRRDKVAKCVAEFENDPAVVMVVHSGRVFGDDLPGTVRYPDYRRRVVAPPAVLPLLPTAPGFAVVVRRQVIELCSPDDPVSAAWTGGTGHDTIVAFWASALGTTVLLPDDLVDYRQHRSNVWGAPERGALAGVRRTGSWIGDEVARLAETADRDRARARLLSERLGAAAASRQALARAELWRRRAGVNDRRATLYASRSGSLSAARCLLADVARGDYGSRARARAGLTSLGRDGLYAVGLLGLLGGPGTPRGRRPARRRASP